jgi:hypothetical protein
MCSFSGRSQHRIMVHDHAIRDSINGKADDSIALAGHGAFEQVHRADEVRHQAIRRRFVDRSRRSRLNYPSRIHHTDTRCEAHRFFLIVRDHDERDSDFVLDAHQFELSLLTQPFVERRERFV